MDDEVVVPMWRYRPHAIIGGPVDSFTISLNFCDEKLNPAVLTEKFGVHPTESLSVGEKRKPRSPPSKRGLWVYRLKGAPPKNPNDLLLELIEAFDPVKSEIKEVSDKYYGRIFVGIFLEGWNRGCCFESGVLGWLSEAGLQLDLDIYGPLDLDE